ncbi:hypothetical protein ACSTS3_09080 [Aquimarina muelleri]|uniref:hypothetical protein n=1 Tax=Aquimarina muelleri TaxID=279356 RepID=UPI003F682C62
MNKLLLTTISVIFLFSVDIVYSQSDNFIGSLNFEQKNIFLSNFNLFVKQETTPVGKKVFSYIFNVNKRADHLNHEHSHEVSLLDVITSDEGSDFNCSGGFCMNKSHSHKKGLTLKKQFFVYFMNITC